MLEKQVGNGDQVPDWLPIVAPNMNLVNPLHKRDEAHKCEDPLWL